MDDLTKQATFDALYEHFRAQDFNAFGWQRWPKAYQNPASDEVKAFKAEYAERIGFFAYLQWLAHRQLKGAANTAKEKRHACWLIP